jgi:7-cyano-7-deazaguanine synthase in queuosine biosynthesis
MIVTAPVKFFNLDVDDNGYVHQHEDPVPLVLLSGGLDSTFLAFKLLKETNIDILYIEGRQDPNKVKAEIKALDTIVSTLNANSEFKIVNCFLAKTVDLGFNRMLFSQPSYWLFSTLHAYSEKIHSKVCMSYVVGDGISSMLPYLKTAWDNLSFALKHKPIPLEFPLQLYSKTEILNSLPKEYVEHTWSCELPIVDETIENVPKFTPCQKCTACITRKVEEFRISLLDKPHDTYPKRDSLYCLGNGSKKECDTCQHQKTWEELNTIPNSERLQKQGFMTRIDDMRCILNKSFFYKPTNK